MPAQRDAPSPGIAAVFARSSNPMFIADDDRRYVDVNEAALRLLRTDRAHLLSLKIDDITPASQRGDVPAVWAHFLEVGYLVGEFTLCRFDGTEIVVHYNAQTNISPGHHLSIMIDAGQSDGLPMTLGTAENGAVDSGSLSPREREIMRLVAYGLSGTQIGEQCNISPGTVRVHVRNAIRKLGAKTRAQAIGIAVTQGVI